MNDQLSAALGRVTLARWKAGVVSVARDSTVEVPPGFGGLYAVASGCIRLRSSHNSPQTATLVAGDFGLTLLGDGFRLSEGTGSIATSFDDFLDYAAGRGFNGVNTTTIVFGFFPLSTLGTNPFVSVLPEIIHLSGRASPILVRAQSIVELISEEQQSRVAGWEATVNSLVHVLLLQTLRAYVTTQPGVPRQANWLRASMDPTIGPVLVRIHTEPEKPWTVNALAREANMAKSAFSERFREVVGEPPLQYLTRYRMQKACEFLCESDLGVKEIAARVGYEAASSFSNAFKRLIGKSPADFRKNLERDRDDGSQ